MYLVGATNKWNDGKRAELDDRVAHTGNHMRVLGHNHLEGVNHYGTENTGNHD